jgi:hypothetical protein
MPQKLWHKHSKNMGINNANDMRNAQDILNSLENNQNVKVVKKDKGLIARESVENKKVILAEDNREILLG